MNKVLKKGPYPPDQCDYVEQLYTLSQILCLCAQKLKKHCKKCIINNKTLLYRIILELLNKYHSTQFRQWVY